MDIKGHISNEKSLKKREEMSDLDQIVLEKGIFSKVFEKDIRRVYIYKKSEMIAKAITMISPAFKDSKAIRDRVQRISVEIIDASILPPSNALEVLSRELLALSSLLRLARSGGLLSRMNADIIIREALDLLQEVSSYEDPKIALDETPTIATLVRNQSSKTQSFVDDMTTSRTVRLPYKTQGILKGQKENKKDKGGRKEAILSILKSKGPSYIKDLSTLIREVSEKTIQRELQSLVQEGRVSKTGERRWTTYALNKSVSDTNSAAEQRSGEVDLETSLG